MVDMLQRKVGRGVWRGTLSGFLPFSDTKRPLPQIPILGCAPHHGPGLLPEKDNNSIKG